MECVAPHVAIGIIDIVADPIDVLGIVDEPPTCMGHLDLVFVGLKVGDLKAMLTDVIACALDFIPHVAAAGHAVAVHVHTHHDNTGFATAAGLVVHSIALESVAVNLHIIVVLVDNRMVKAEDNVAAKTAKADDAVGLAYQSSFYLCKHVGLGVTRLIGRFVVDELAGSGQIVIHMSNVR